MHTFSKEVKIVPILDYASGTADRTSNVIDTAGFDGCLIAIHNATIAAGLTADYYLQHADAASDATTLTSGADVATSSQTIAADDDDEVFYMDIVAPQKRFFQLVVNNDGANASAQSAVAYLYRNKSTVPVTHADGSGTSGGTEPVSGEVLVNPASGTK